MKQILFVAALACAPAFAHAEAFSCRATNAGPDHGYMVEVSEDETQAEVSEQTIAGPRVITTLNCAPAPSRPGPRGADIPEVFLTCSEPHLRDGGYSATFTSGGFAGLTQGQLKRVTIAGAETIARLICPRK